ncbi:MAG: maltotransferase domain-containing protein [Microthrixaceae bacterium]
MTSALNNFHSDSENLLQSAQRILIRDVSPVTPTQAPAKAVQQDAVKFGATLVSDGHSLLAARLRWRRVDIGGSSDAQAEQTWQTQPLAVAPSGQVSSAVRFAQLGLYEFQVQAWKDSFTTWRRDLQLFATAAEPLELEFEEGARLLEVLAQQLPADSARRVASAIEQLRSKGCTDRVRLAAATDDAVAKAVAGISTELTTSPSHLFRVEPELAVRGAWYEFFPRSEGGLHPGANSWKRLDQIADAGFDVLYLPPIHPIGISQRKGRNNSLTATPQDVGSPWAVGSQHGGHTAVHPELGTVEDLRAFVAKARQLGVAVALDYVLHCSPDHPWVSEHPEWFTKRSDGSIRYAENPPKKYQDIFPLNFWPEQDSDRVALWQACLQILEFWVDCGVEVFRVDNPHTKPLAFWAWILRELQATHPQVVFLSEAFTDPAMMHSLAEIGFSQSYTYFAWRQSKDELTSYGEELAHGATAAWFRPNLWPTTPDILADPLRGGSCNQFAVRAILAAMLSPSWGIYSGYELCENTAIPHKEEYGFSEKYELKKRDHNSPESLWPLLSNLNRIRRAHRATWRMDSLRFHHVDHDSVIAFTHHSTENTHDAEKVDTGLVDTVLVVLNLKPDDFCEATVYLDLDAIGLSGANSFKVTDELTQESWAWGVQGNYVRFDPAERVAHVLSLTV